METEKPGGTHTLWPFILILLIVIAVVFVAYRYRGVVYAEMTALKLTPIPERFTELYFTDPSAIPTSIAPGQTLSFSFTINNTEGTNTAYPYIIYFKDPTGMNSVIDSDEVLLPDNTSTTIPVSYTFPASKDQTIEQGEVIVELPSQNDQQIDFFLPKNNS